MISTSQALRTAVLYHTPNMVPAILFPPRCTLSFLDHQASFPTEGQKQDKERPNAMIPLDRSGGGGGSGGDGAGLGGATDASAAAVVLLLACYQNLIGVLHTGLKASRWRPHPR